MCDFGFGVSVGFLAGFKDATFVDVHKFAVVVYGLKHWGVGQFFFDTAGAKRVDFFFVGISEDFKNFFLALRTHIGTVDKLLSVFN